MGRGSAPGELEQLVLLTLAGLEPGATGRAVYEALTAATGRDASVAAVHITLARLYRKGWATCETGTPPPGTGGKTRRYYSLSANGAELLTDLRAQLDRLWDAARRHPLLDDR
jgi:DNA-binding PadR family transcriptional regulator